MKFCEECGAQLEDDALFCEECGAEQEPLAVEPVQEPEVAVPCDSVAEETTEYGFCEECGSKIKLTDAFCESCGTAIVRDEPVEETPKPVVEEPRNEKPVIQTEPTEVRKSEDEVRKSEDKVKPKKKTPVLWIVLAIVGMSVFAAGGYLLGSGKIGAFLHETTDGNKVQSDTVPSVTEDSGITDSVPETAVTVTPTEVPAASAQGKSIFAGFREIELMGLTKQLKASDGLNIVMEDLHTAARPRISMSYGEHYFEFDVMFTDDAWVYYPECVMNGASPESGDEVRIYGLHDGNHKVKVYWANHDDGKTTVYYDGEVSAKKLKAFYHYGRYLNNSLKYFPSTDQLGKMQEVVYTGDDNERFTFGLTYDCVDKIDRIELYNYEQEAYLCAYVNGPLYYLQDTVYYLIPVQQGDTVYWEEIVHDGISSSDLESYGIYCIVKIHVDEEGISMYWYANQYGEETIYYDAYIPSKYISRMAYVRKY